MKEPIGIGLWVTAVAALAGVLANWVTGWFQKPKVEADAEGIKAATESVAITNAKQVIDIVNAAVGREREECQASIAKLTARLFRCEQALRDNGIPIPIGEA